MEYSKRSKRTYAKAKDGKFKAGARVDGDGNCSLLEATAEAGLETSEWGISAGAGASAHALKVECDGDVKVDARVLGADAGVKAGADLMNFLGAKAKARLSMADLKAGPAELHLGLGVSTGAKVEDGTAEVKAAGCGFKVGKKIGVSVLDNEFSVDPLAFVGKGWLWK